MRSLSREQRLCALPAVGLVLSLLLPWYRETAPGGASVVSSAQSAFASFSWVEAALLLVSGSVLVLLWLRAQQRGFHLPGGDGWAVTIAGGWAAVLLVWRLFDRPGVPEGSVGVEWGIFVSMLMAGLLLAAGQRLRAAHVAEPPNPAATGEHEVARRVEPRPVAAMPSREAARGDLESTAEGAPSRAAARADLGLDDDLTVQLPRDDEAPRRLAADDADPDATRRLRDEEDDQYATRRLPPDDPDATRRLADDARDAIRRHRETDDDATRRLPLDDDRTTRRFLEDDDATRRLPPDIPPPPPSPPPPPPGRGGRDGR